MLTMVIRQPIFIHIVNVLDLHFQGQTFELSTSGSLYVIILQMVTDRTNIASADTGSRMWPFDWHIYI